MITKIKNVYVEVHNDDNISYEVITIKYKFLGLILYKYVYECECKNLLDDNKENVGFKVNGKN